MQGHRLPLFVVPSQSEGVANIHIGMLAYQDSIVFANLHSSKINLRLFGANGRTLVGSRRARRFRSNLQDMLKFGSFDRIGALFSGGDRSVWTRSDDANVQG
jgi:hypothetical protein